MNLVRLVTKSGNLSLGLDVLTLLSFWSIYQVLGLRFPCKDRTPDEVNKLYVLPKGIT